ncbi:unnamed protein product [Zymoseptoria tritici ST99CH_1E4]|uniref:Peptidase S26 domain-containing protein n=2 Tax=Zymoseptoria tritici TaxID=1047171 RepID=A0A2H1G3R9_ZYMTR|nr:unnamed protein product [Zymoseptoria tritici ST99CH_1E4]
MQGSQGIGGRDVFESRHPQGPPDIGIDMLRWSLRRFVTIRPKHSLLQPVRNASRKPFNTSHSSHNVGIPGASKSPTLSQIWLNRVPAFVKSGLIGFLAFHVITGYFYTFVDCYGVSMLPTIYSSGEWVFISKYYRRGRGVIPGDLVSFDHPVKEGRAIKRVIALSGDFVLMNSPDKSDAMIQIPEGHCWVVGDNLPHSRDSRMFGPLPMALINGKVTAKVSFERWSLPELVRFDGFKPAIEDDV